MKALQNVLGFFRREEPYLAALDGILKLALGKRLLRAERVVGYARRVSQTLDGGFVRCSQCGEQEDTTDTDFAPELRAALEEYDAEVYPSDELQAALCRVGGPIVVDSIEAALVKEGSRALYQGGMGDNDIRFLIVAIKKDRVVLSAFDDAPEFFERVVPK